MYTSGKIQVVVYFDIFCKDFIRLIRSLYFLPNADGLDLMETLFQGQLVLRTRCLECESFTERREDFQDISVPVLDDSPSSPDDFSSGEDVYSCRRQIFVLHFIQITSSHPVSVI